MFQGFDSGEDMMDALSEAIDRADEETKLWQTQIKPGHCIIMLQDDLWIIGQVLEQSEPENYRLAKCYSDYLPEGETGDIHVCTVVGIMPETVFNQCLEILKSDEGEIGGVCRSWLRDACFMATVQEWHTIQGQWVSNLLMTVFDWNNVSINACLLEKAICLLYDGGH